MRQCSERNLARARDMVRGIGGAGRMGGGRVFCTSETAPAAQTGTCLKRDSNIFFRVGGTSRSSLPCLSIAANPQSFALSSSSIDIYNRPQRQRHSFHHDTRLVRAQRHRHPSWAQTDWRKESRRRMRDHFFATSVNSNHFASAFVLQQLSP
jgi:hypothetical protein